MKFSTRVLRIAPDTLLRVALPKRLQFDRTEASELRFVGKQTRLVIGPVNFAGQGWAWARAAERIPGVEAVAMATSGPGGSRFNVDQAVPASVFQFSRRWERAQRDALLGSATHILVESGRALLADGTPIAEFVAMARARGIRVGHIAHGSDVRDGRRHASADADSPYHDAEWDARDQVVAAAEVHRQLMHSTGAPVFVSTPGLIDDVPHARWLPVAVATEKWRTPRAAFSTACPLVVHAPSSTRVKGSEMVEPALEALAREGVIRYRRISGVSHEEMPAVFASADIVLDQFRLGDYGVAACEAMASGCLVIGHVHPHVRELVQRETGRQLPIVQSRGGDIEHVLRAALAEPEEAARTARAGVEFVAAVHDGMRSADALRGFLNG